MTLKVVYRRLRPKEYQAIVTDEQGNRWVWSKPIHERLAEYQGPFSMLGSTHKTTVYNIEGYGAIPESLSLSNNANDFIVGRFTECPEEFDPFYSLAKLSKSQRKYITRRN